MGILLNLVRVWGLSLVAATAVYRSFLTTGCVFLGGAVGLFALMQLFTSTSKINEDLAKSTPVASGKIRVCIGGYSHSAPNAKAHRLADLIAAKHADKYETWMYFEQYSIWKFLARRTEKETFPAHLKGWSTAPFCYLEDFTGKFTPLGGSDELSAWVLENFTDEEIVAEAKAPWKGSDYITGRAFHMSGQGLSLKGTAQN